MKVDCEFMECIYTVVNEFIDYFVFILMEDRILWANRSALGLFGLSLERVVGKYLFELIPSIVNNENDGDLLIWC